MDNQWWSWILTAVGLTGFVFVGRKDWWAWYINIGCQVLWFSYAIVTAQYGFIVAALAYTIVFTRNAIKWTKDHFVILWDAENEHTVLRSIRAKTVEEAAAQFTKVTGQEAETIYQHGAAQE